MVKILSGGREKSICFEIVPSNYHAANKGEKVIALSNVGSEERILISKESLLQLVKFLNEAL